MILEGNPTAHGELIVELYINVPAATWQSTAERLDTLLAGGALVAEK